MKTTEPRERIRKREFIIHGILICVVLAVIFPGTFLRGERILPGGMLAEKSPWKHHMPDEAAAPKNWLTGESLVFFNKTYALTQEVLESGEWPLWNHREFLGMPLLADYQCAPFYPPRLLHTFLDLHLATTIFILLKLWLCGMTSYLCARVLKMKVSTARFFSAAFMLSGYVLTWTYWPEPSVVAWLPVLFMGVELLLQGRWRKGFFSMTLGAVLLLISGHPESAFAMGLGIGMYFLARLVWERRWGRGLWAPMGLACAAWGVALLVCAVQILPFLEYLANCHALNERAVDEVSKRFVPLGAFVCLWVPRFYGATADGNFWSDPLYVNSNFVSLIYPGIAVWFGAACLFLKGRNARDMWRRGICLGVPYLFLVLMTFRLDSMNVIHGLPMFSAMWRCWYVSFTMFALAMIAAMGVEAWGMGQKRFRDLAVFAGLGLVVAVSIGLMKLLHGPFMRSLDMDAYVNRQLFVAGSFAGACFLAFALSCFSSRFAKVLPLVLVIVLTGDLIFAGRDLHPTCPKEWLFPDTELTDFLAEQKPAPRVGVLTAGLEPGLFLPYGIEQLWGYEGIYPHRNVQFLGTLGLPTAPNAVVMEPVCGVNYYLHDPDTPMRLPFDEAERFRSAGTIDGLEVYENLKAFPRAFLVGDAEVVEESAALFERMADENYDPAKVVLLEKPLPRAMKPVEGSDPGAATVLLRSSNRVDIAVNAKEDCVLVLSDAYYPGWRATINEEPAEIFPAYSLFRGVQVPAGEHTVAFRFEPWTFRVGLAVSAGTLVVSAAGTVLMLLLGRKKRAVPVEARA